MQNLTRFATLLAAALLLGTPRAAAEQTAPVGEVLDLELGQLLDQTVTTATKTAQKATPQCA
jgi:hypothetical protein